MKKEKTVDYASEIEKKVLSVMDLYRRLIPCKVEDMQAVFGMGYNKLKDNLQMTHHPKLKVLLDVFLGWFPEMEENIFPDVSPELAKRLHPSEVQTRILAACLNNDRERMREVGTLLIKLADKELPSLSVLEKLLKEKEADKKKH